MNAIHAAYYRAKQADEIWSANLKAKYGKQASDKRYELGEGDRVDGYQEFRAAMDAWHELVKATWIYQVTP